MAKRATKAKVTKVTTNKSTNKSQWIRDYLGAHPTAGPSEVVVAAKAAGIDILPSAVSNIKGKLGLSKSRQQSHRAGTKSGLSVSIPEIVKFVETKGIENVEAVIGLLKR
jgi:hypothetical protein